MTLWRKVASVLVTLVGTVIGLLLASRRGGAGSQHDRDEAATDQKRIDEIDARMAATQQTIMAEQKKQRGLAQDAAVIDGALAQVDVRVEGLTHDNLDAEIHRALDGPAGPGAAPVIVKPGRVIKPAN
jgi:hypothetical protein